jgi:hypothetical protein
MAFCANVSKSRARILGADFNSVYLAKGARGTYEHQKFLACTISVATDVAARANSRDSGSGKSRSGKSREETRTASPSRFARRFCKGFQSGSRLG